MKRIINVFIAGMLLSSVAFAKTAPFFKIVEAGAPAAVEVSLCLNGISALSCQNYHISAQNIRISTTAVHHYPAVGIKVLTSGYPVNGCTPYPNGYCLFAASNTKFAPLFLGQMRNQTITITTPPPTSAPYKSIFTVAATATSGLPVVFSSQGPCSNSGATYTMISGTGTCNVIASQPGNLEYKAAPTLIKMVTAARLPQATLTAIATPSTVPYHGTSALTRTGGSGTGAVTYAVTSGAGNCSISGTTLTGTGVGSCNVTATKAANKNYQSTVSSPITVTVAATLPGAPTIGTASAGYASATVNWSAPANTGGVAITNYIITPYIGVAAQTPTTVGNVVTTNLTGLTNGSVYTFRVRAISSAGTGPASANSNAVTPLADGTHTVPAFPQTVVATAAPGQVTLTWAAPNNPFNGPVTGYTVLYGQTSTATYTTPAANCQQTSATTCTITGLLGVPYTFTVSATNASGTGPVAYSSPATPLGTSLNANPANLALSGLGGGASRVITFTNSSGSSVDVNAVQFPTLPAGASLDSSSSDDCSQLPTLASGESCTITIDPGSAPTATSGCTDATTLPVPGVVTVVTSLDSITANIVILGYGCQYQKGYVYSINDLTPVTSSIGGKVVSLIDQAAPPFPWAMINDTIWGIDDTSTSLAPSPNTTSFAVLLPGQLNCNATNDGSCATNNIFVRYGVGTNYAVGRCKTTIDNYTDWYLPSICDLGPFNSVPGGTYPAAPGSQNCTGSSTNIQNTLIPLVTNFNATNYFSSTEYSELVIFEVWGQTLSVGGGSQQDTLKGSISTGARCVRNLTL